MIERRLALRSLRLVQGRIKEDPPLKTKGGPPAEKKLNAEVAEETRSNSRSLALLGMTRCWNGRQDAGSEEGSFAQGALRMTMIWVWR